MIDRYTTAEMRDLWSERSKFQSWVDVELAACEAWYERGAIPESDMATIRERMTFDVARIEELDAVLHHDVLAFTTCLAENIGPASRHVHKGLTSTDVVDTAQALRLRAAGELLLAEIGALREALLGFAEQHKAQPMIGRTHGIHGEPITLGLKFLVFYDTLGRDLARLKSAFEDVSVAKLSGAVGTYAHTDAGFELSVAQRLGLPTAAIATQVLARDRHAALLSAVAVAGGSIETIALEIRHLQRTEVRELEEPFAKGQKGSSAMPHKRNPVKCEQLCGLARLLRGFAIAGLEGQALWHERDISHSSVERVALADATTLLHYMARLATKVVKGLHVYPDAMKANLEKMRGLLYSQRVMLALVDAGMTREEAYKCVQDASMRTWADANTTLKAELAKETAVVSALGSHPLDTLFDPLPYLRHVDGIFASVKAKWHSGI